jgi:hypothetical protein
MYEDHDSDREIIEFIAIGNNIISLCDDIETIWETDVLK